MYSELEFVLRYISKQIEEQNLIELHNQLAELYEQALSAPSEEVSTNITNLQEQIKNAQTKVNPRDWDTIKLKIFVDFGAAEVLGTNGYNFLIKDTSRFSNDPHGVSQAIKTFSSSLTNIKQRAEQAINSLEPLFGKEEKFPEGIQKIQLVFDDLVAIEKLESLKHQAHEWDIILKNFQLVVPGSKEEPKLWKLYKSSPTTIVILAPEQMILAIGGATFLALKIVEKLYSIRKLKLEIRKAELENDKAEKMLELAEKAEQEKLEKLIRENVSEMMKKYKKGLSKGDANVADNAVRFNIKKIYNFTVQGGSVNLVDGEIKDGENKISQSQFTPIYEKLKDLLTRGDERLQLASFSQKENEEAEKRTEGKIEVPPEEPKKEIIVDTKKRVRKSRNKKQVKRSERSN